MTTSNSRSLWRNPGFSLLWTGRSLSVLGEAVALIAIPLLVLDVTRSVVQMGLVTATFSVGWLLMGFFSGSLVDRLDRRLILVASSLGRCLVFLLFAFAWHVHGPGTWMFYVVVLFLSMLGIMHWNAYMASIPAVVPPAQLDEANAHGLTSWAVCQIAGPLLAGLALSNLGAVGVLGFSAAVYLVTAALAGLLRLAPAQGETAPPEALSLASMAAGLHHLWTTPVLKSVMLITALVVAGLAACNDLFIYLLKSGLRQDDQVVGLFFGLTMTGAVLGGLIGPKLRQWLGFGTCFTGSLALEGLCLVGVASSARLGTIIFWAGLYQLTQQVRIMALISLNQKLTPSHLMGRVTAASLMLISLPAPIGIALATAAARHTGSGPVLAAIGLFTALVASAGFFTVAGRHERSLARGA